MKQKIKIMKHEPNPSDEEIQSYMNFDRLLEKRRVPANTSKVKPIISWSIAVVAVTALVIWFLSPRGTVQPVVEKTSKMEDSAVRSTPSSPLVLDSLPSEDSMSKEPKGELSQVQPAVPKKPTVQRNADAVASEEAYTQAEPLHGYSNLYDYFNSNLVYPTEALKDSIQGVQTISFVINAEGKPEKIDVVKSLGEPFEKEAKRLIENMPAWKSATLNGKPVASKISVPITFQIQKIKK